ncbi:hypothetical protein [Enterobacter kobei]
MCVILFGVVCLVAAVHGPGTLGRRIYAVLARGCWREPTGALR